MLSQCVNPQCSKPFLRLREGKLFLVEAGFRDKSAETPSASSGHARKPPRRVERYWLCDECAAYWTLIDDGEQGIRLAPLRRPVTGVSAVVRAACGGVA
jgi:hypothetical protein